jgi:hypothetical protein
MCAPTVCCPERTVDHAVRLSGMNLQIPGPPAGPGLWDAVKYALEQKDRDATRRLAVLLLIIYGLCCGTVWFDLRALGALLHAH